MIYKELLQLSKNAVNRIIRMAQCGEEDLTDFHERQLVHALFLELDSIHKDLWAAFEYRYFKGERWLDGKADIRAWAKNYYAWFEIKSTGLNPDGWDNSHLGIWEDDVKKLIQVCNQKRTQAGWVWLFLFETYRVEVERLGVGNNWTSPQRAEKIAYNFGKVDTESGRLAHSLSEAGAFAVRHGTKAYVSIIPQLQRAAYNVWKGTEYSALLLTMDLTRNIRRST